MKRFILLSVLFFLAAAGNATALDCTGTRIGDTLGEIQDIIEGMIVCGTEVPASGSDQWQEEHHTLVLKDGVLVGELWERAKGDDTVDPRHQEGTWKIKNLSSPSAADEVICYNYSSAGEFCFYLFGSG